MSELVLKLSSKKLNNIVHYQKDHYYTFPKKQTDFLAHQKQKVVKLNRSQKRKLLKLLGLTSIALTTFLIISHPTFAATSIITQATPTTITPDGIEAVGNQLIKIMEKGGMILAILAAITSGMYNFLKKQKLASEWLVEILKGYTVVVVSPVLIMGIAVLAWLLFGNLPWFVSPF